MRSKDELGLLMNSVFQVAEITRPLMSVSRICDQDMVCICEKDHGMVLDSGGNTVARFERHGDLYTFAMSSDDLKMEMIRVLFGWIDRCFELHVGIAS